MKLSILHENLIQPFLNILANPDDVKVAMDMMEHDGFYDYSMTSDSTVNLKTWFEAYDRKKSKHLDAIQELKDVQSGKITTVSGFEGLTRDEAIIELKFVVVAEFNVRNNYPKGLFLFLDSFLPCIKFCKQ